MFPLLQRGQLSSVGCEETTAKDRKVNDLLSRVHIRMENQERGSQ